jgi:uncharacterized protein (DUF58 family)
MRVAPARQSASVLAVPDPQRRGIQVDWGRLAPLRLRARSIAEGVYAGAHRSLRKGAGVEFGGHRAYVPGDDLRWLDRRALLRHDRLLVREFETETDRALRLIVDASGSMGFRSAQAPGSKLAYAAVIGAALARLAVASGDPVGLDWIGGEAARPVPAGAGREGFERILGCLESVRAFGEVAADPALLECALAPIARRARRGSIIVLLSDLLDLPSHALDRFVALGSGGRILVVVQVLDPEEIDFPFEGTIRLRALEGPDVVETDAGAVRARYLAALASISDRWTERLRSHRGHFFSASTCRDPGDLVRDIVAGVAGREAREKDSG